MHTLAARSLLLLGALAACSCGFSQEFAKQDKAPQPKLGLVLEGGGALGLAYIGVITWMEEHHIPVSYAKRVSGPPVSLKQ
jgi:NTE family protein